MQFARCIKVLQKKKIYQKIKYDDIKHFNMQTHSNQLDNNERKMILNVIDTHLQLQNLRHNAFNFSYKDQTLDTDNETLSAISKCIAHINIILNDNFFDLIIVFRAINITNNFEFDMTTIRLICDLISFKTHTKCRNIHLIIGVWVK